MAHVPKNMVIISLQKLNEEVYYSFEEEVHYLFKHRVKLSTVQLSDTKKDSLSKDSKLHNTLGYKIALHLLTNKEFSEEHNKKQHALVIYQYEKNGEHSIRLDTETYKPKTHRKFCMSALAPSCDTSITINDSMFLQKLGKTLIEYLSFNPNEHFEDYRELVTKERPYMFEKQ